jgi:hypothetical protein
MWKTAHRLTKLTNTLTAPSVEVVTAEDTNWAKSYAPCGNEEVYALLSKYAEKQYDSILNHFDTADKKADEHLRFMTAAIGAVIALVASKVVGVSHPYPLVAGGFLVLGAFVVAIIARMPRSSSFPMTPRALLAVADLEPKPSKHQIESAIVTTYQIAITGTRSAVEWKSRLVRISTYTFYVGFALVLRSLLPS